MSPTEAEGFPAEIGPLVMPADEFATVKDLKARLEHAETALAGDNEGCRLWMLDCGNLVEQWRQRCGQETSRAERAYANGWRDCALALAAAFEKRAEGVTGGDRSLLVRVMAPTMAAIFREAAEDARRQAQNVPDAPAGTDQVPVDPAGRTGAPSVPGDMDPLFEVPNG